MLQMSVTNGRDTYCFDQVRQGDKLCRRSFFSMKRQPICFCWWPFMF